MWVNYFNWNLVGVSINLDNEWCYLFCKKLPRAFLSYWCLFLHISMFCNHTFIWKLKCGDILVWRLNLGNVRSRCLRGGSFWTIFRECVIRFYNWNANAIYQTNELCLFHVFSTMTKWGETKIGKIKYNECSFSTPKASGKTKAFCKSYIKRDGYLQYHYLTILKMDFGNDIGIFSSHLEDNRIMHIYRHIYIFIYIYISFNMDWTTL